MKLNLILNIKQDKLKTLRKRKIQIYSSDSSNSSGSVENVFNSKTIKGKVTKGLPIKRGKGEKTIRDPPKILKIKNDD